MAGTLSASIVKDPTSATNNITLGATGNVTFGAAATTTGSASMLGAASVGGLLTLGSSGIRMVNGSNTTNVQNPSTAGTYTLTLPAATGTAAYVNANVLPAYDGSQLINVPGAYNLLTSGSTGAVSQFDLILTSYTAYQSFIFYITAPSGTVYFRTSTDGGTTFSSGGSDYNYISAVANGATWTVSETVGFSLGTIVPGGSNSTWPIFIVSPFNSSIRTSLNMGPIYDNSQLNIYAGTRTAAENNNAIRFLPFSGTFSFSYILYGIK